MAYQNLTLSSIAGEITATFNDNNMRRNLTPERTAGPRLHLLGTANTGVNNEVFVVNNTTEAMQEYDPSSELTRVLYASREANALSSVSVSRIGAKPFHVQIKQSIPGSYEKDSLVNLQPLVIQIADTTRGIKSTLDVLKAVFLPFEEGGIARQRVLIYNIANDGRSSVVYDSERIKRSTGDSIFNVDLNLPLGKILYTESAFPAADRLADGYLAEDFDTILKTESFDLSSVEFLSSSTVSDQLKFVDVFTKTVQALDDADIEFSVIQGSVKDSLNQCERYASSEKAYTKLEFENIDYIFCDKCFADTKPVELSESMSINEVIQWAGTKLGYMWKYEFNGDPYMFMFGRKTPFSAENVDSYVHSNIAYTFSDNQKALGDLLNLVNVTLHVEAGAETSVESFADDHGLIQCHVTIDVPVDGAPITAATPFVTLTIPSTTLLVDGDTRSMRLRPSLIGTSRAVSDYLLNNPTAIINDPFVIGHFDMLGELVPEAVVHRLVTFAGEGDDTAELATVFGNDEVREVSFLHQAASAAYRASSNYSQTIAIVPTTAPSASSNGIAVWAGSAPEYTVNADGSITVKKNGTGVLGTKLLAGAIGYRDSAAFGGIILTNGEKLPNKIPYGIDDTDEAIDASGNAIDLGKHAIVVGAYGFVADPRTVFPAQRGRRPTPRAVNTKFMSAAPLIASMITALEPGSEPIGPVRGRIPGFTPQQRTPRAILDNLAALRICMVDQTGVISSIYTSALRTSDYTKLSSIISANVILGRLRSICASVIGAPYRDEQIASLNQTIDGNMRALVRSGYAQDIRVSLSGSQLDRLNGVLRASVVFVPPLSIEAISIDITLEAPSTGLNA